MRPNLLFPLRVLMMPERCEELDNVLKLYSESCHIHFATNVFGHAQNPAMEPARVTECILPVMMHRDNFFVSGQA
jgi:hypothetical protein